MMVGGRQAVLGGAAALALALASCRPRAGRERITAVDRALAAAALPRLCDAYTNAARRFPDPARAYAHVDDSYVSIWPPLIKGRAGISGVEPSIRYDLWLRFGRNDYGVRAWACPALDKLLLGLVAQQAPKPAIQSDERYPLVRVSASGAIFIDHRPIQVATLADELTRLEERSGRRIIELYREGWSGAGWHPNADRALDALVERPFLVAMCAAPDCGRAQD
jgi:hypothetical protein